MGEFALAMGEFALAEERAYEARAGYEPAPQKSRDRPGGLSYLTRLAESW